MYEGLKVIGLSHDSSPIAIRESVAFSENECRNFLDRMREILGVEEALILSTCNRTEIYYTSDLDLSNAILNLLKIEKGIDQGIDSYFWNREKLPALRHLFRVALGLEASTSTFPSKNSRFLRRHLKKKMCATTFDLPF